MKPPIARSGPTGPVAVLFAAGAAACGAGLASPALAGPRRAGPAVTVVEVPAKRWAKTERLEVDHPLLGQERFIPLVEHQDEEIVEAFGGDRSPPSSHVLLHYAHGWEQGTDPVPVLLVHGAGVTANHCWADHPIEQPYEGLAARLVRSGRKAFALTFAHPHGCNLKQAEALAAVIARVLEVTGAPRLDLVAWSKGGVSTRVYLSDAGPDGSTRYRGDVRRYVMLGTPNGGIDLSFAYPNLNYWILEHRTPAPLSFLRCMYYGLWKDTSEQSIYGQSAFPGQAQMVARWDQRYGRTRAKGQLDVDATYDGTKGTVTESLGIARAIDDGGRLIERLERRGLDPSLEVSILAGTHFWIMNMVGERRGPSDGLILVGTVHHTDGLLRRGARLLRRDLRAVNHFQLAYEPRANDWVVEALSEPSPPARGK